MKASKVLLCSRNPIYGVSVGQENRLDVTNPHTERFFLNLKKRPAVGVWYRLISSKTLRRKPLLFSVATGKFYPQWLKLFTGSLGQDVCYFENLKRTC